MNVSIPITVPEDYSATERKVLEDAFQNVVDTFRELRGLIRPGTGREMALVFHVDEQLVIRGAHIDWKLRTAVARR